MNQKKFLKKKKKKKKWNKKSKICKDKKIFYAEKIWLLLIPLSTFIWETLHAQVSQKKSAPSASASRTCRLMMKEALSLPPSACHPAEKQPR